MDDDLRNRFRRDFTSGPIGQAHRPLAPRPAPAPPTPQPLQPPQPQTTAKTQGPVTPSVSFEPQTKVKPRRRRKKILLIGILLLIIICGGAAVYWYKLRPPSSPIPADIRQSAGFPLLYPARLPAGYHINPASFANSKGAVIFEADNQSGGKIVFSEQKRPATFDFPSFYKQGLGGASPFTTAVGEAAIGKANGQTIGSIATDQSWMLVTSAHQLPDESLRLVLENIKPAAN